MPKGIVFKFTKHIKRQRFFGVLFYKLCKHCANDKASKI